MPVDEDRLQQSVSALGAAVPSHPADMGAFLRCVVEATDDVLGVSGTAVMLVDDHHDLRCVATTTDVASLFEQAQLEAGQGPCIDCYALDTLVEVSNLDRDQRWPALSSITGGHIQALLATPVHVGRIPVGSLNTFLSEGLGSSDADRRALEAYGRIVGRALHLMTADIQMGDFGIRFNDALESRAVTERAVGYLMAQQGVDAVSALHVLRKASRQRRQPIGAVAARLLEEGRLS